MAMIAMASMAMVVVVAAMAVTILAMVFPIEVYLSMITFVVQVVGWNCSETNKCVGNICVELNTIGILTGGSSAVANDCGIGVSNAGANIATLLNMWNQ